MPDVQIVSKGFECCRCGHQWVPSGATRPAVCPKCRSVYWDRPRTRKPKGGASRT